MIQVEERKSTAYDPYKALGLAIIEAAATVYKDALEIGRASCRERV